MPSTPLTKLEALIRSRPEEDLHLYFDHSGINDAATHQSALRLLTELAQKYNRQLFVNTFSHVLSDEALLFTQEHTFDEVWVQYSALYKVQGGTDFAVVWANILSNEERAERINLMVTDFKWWPNQDLNLPDIHPKNLHYLSLDELYFSQTDDHQRAFTHQMSLAIAPDILDRMLDKGSNNLTLALEPAPVTDWEERYKESERGLKQVLSVVERHWPKNLIGSVPRTEAEKKAQEMATEIRNIITNS